MRVMEEVIDADPDDIGKILGKNIWYVEDESGDAYDGVLRRDEKGLYMDSKHLGHIYIKSGMATILGSRAERDVRFRIRVEPKVR